MYCPVTRIPSWPRLPGWWAPPYCPDVAFAPPAREVSVARSPCSMLIPGHPVAFRFMASFGHPCVSTDLYRSSITDWRSPARVSLLARLPGWLVWWLGLCALVRGVCLEFVPALETIGQCCPAARLTGISLHPHRFFCPVRPARLPSYLPGSYPPAR